MDECSYLKLAFDFLKKIEKNNDEPLNEENYTQFSNYVNAPIGNKTRHRAEKIQLVKDFEKFNFTDIGDVNPVIFPMILLNRNHIEQNILSALEEKTFIKTNPEVKKKIDKFT